MAMLIVCILCIYVLDQAYSQDMLSEVDKQTILMWHNKFRGRVDPAAANMLEMVWDDDLAKVAQNYAHKCKYRHNPDRTIDQSKFKYVGENIAATTRKNLNYKSLVSMWFNEGLSYDYNSNSCSQKTCGHYTQVVWADSHSLGCGIKRCSEAKGLEGKDWALLFCNYGPGGNYKGEKPYQSGAPCSMCPADRDRCMKHLCAKSGIFNRQSRLFQETSKIL